MTTNLDFENRFFQRLRMVFRAAVILSWLAMLVLPLHGVPKPLAIGAFTVFRGTAVCAALWLIVEMGEATAKRTRVLNPLIDAILTLPMFGLWFLIRASTF
jgi:hypothetical protein